MRWFPGSFNRARIQPETLISGLVFVLLAVAGAPACVRPLLWDNAEQPVLATFDSLAYADSVLADKPLVYWRLGERMGGTLTDIVDGRDATLKGGVQLDQPGALQGDPDTAVRFGGVDGSASAPLDLSQYTTITIEFWLNWDDFSDDDRLAFEYSSTAS